MPIVCCVNGALFYVIPLNGSSDNVILKLYGLSRNMYWLSTCFVIEGLCVQILLRTKLTSLFLLI